MHEPRRLRIDGPAALAGIVRHLVHYQPGPDQIAVLGTGAAGTTSASVLPWTGRDDLLRAQVASVLQMRSEERQWLIVGYGPDGGDRALSVRDQLTSLAPERSTFGAILHVDDDGIVHDHASGAWEPAGAVRNMAEHFVMEGSDPAWSRADHVARYQPYDEPTWQPISHAAHAALEAMPPSQRGARAREILDALAIPGPDQPHADGAWLADAVASNMLVRDAIMEHGYDRDRGAALVELYRGSPQSLRSATAVLAASAMFANGDMVAAGAILPHVHPDTPHASIATLMRQGIEIGASPDMLTAGVARDEIDGLLAADDDRWRVRQGPTGASNAAHRFFEQSRAQQAPATAATRTPHAPTSRRPYGSPDAGTSLER